MNQPREIVVIFDYRLASTSATIDFVEHIMSYLRLRKELGEERIIIQIVKVMGPKAAEDAQDIRSDIQDRRTLEQPPYSIVNMNQDDPAFPITKALELLRNHLSIRLPHVPAVTIFCNTGDKMIVRLFGKFWLRDNAAVHDFPLFQENFLCRIPRLFFEWARTIDD